MGQRKASKDRRRPHKADRFLTATPQDAVAREYPLPLPPTAVSWRITLPCLLVIILAVVAAFHPAMQNELVYWDDDDNLMENAHIRSLSAENLRWMLKGQLLGVWQPLTWFITALEYKLFNGADLKSLSRGMHGANIGLHALAAVLVFFVGRRLIGLAVAERAARNPLGLNVGAAAAAVFFAVHPLRVELVAWASGQPYILAFIPCLGAVWCYLKAQESGRWAWHVAALLCLTLSLLCKAMAVPLVAVLLVLDVYPLRRLGGRQGYRWPQVFRVVIEKVIYALPAIAAAILTILATAANKPDYRAEPFTTKLLASGFCLMFYVFLTFVPVGIAPYYMKATFENVFVGGAWGAVLVTVTAIVLRRRVPWLLAACACYVFVLLPVVGLVKHGGQLAADRYTYLSCLAWAVLVGAAVMRLWSAGGAIRAGTALAVAAVSLGLGAKTASYCRVWKDSVSLWSAMVERNPKYHMGFYNLAKAFKRPADAIWARKARAMRTSSPGPTTQELDRAGQLFAEAEQSYRQAIELYPTYPEANVDLGNMIKDGKAAGGAEGAIERYATALRGRPGFHMALMNLADLLERAGRYDEAVRMLEEAKVDAEKSSDKEDRKRLPGLNQSLERVRRKMKIESGE